MTDQSRDHIAVRPFVAQDNEFLARVADRLHPGDTRSPRDPEILGRFFAQLATGRLLSEPGSEAFVATINDAPVGVVAVHPDADYFTGHPRAYVDILVVSREAEGLGIGRALMEHVAHWARDRGHKEVVLDVFAGNDAAIAFYERVGFQPDHLRMAKSLD